MPTDRPATAKKTPAKRPSVKGRPIEDVPLPDDAAATLPPISEHQMRTMHGLLRSRLGWGTGADRADILDWLSVALGRDVASRRDLSTLDAAKVIALLEAMPPGVATPEALSALRAPFAEEAVGKLPRSTCRACSDSPRKKCEQHQWVTRCGICNNSHSSATMHIDFVGHADVTERLLRIDPYWTWEPMGRNPDGTPALDRNGDLWINLTVLGVTRPGVGDAGNGKGSKERIGDALRNACAARGTLITTARGQVPIEQVRVGDLVLNRSGWHPVTDHWLSNPAAPVVRVEVDTGAVLVATANHRVPTPDGDRCVGDLSNGAMLYAWPDIASSQAPRSSGGVAASGDALPAAATSRPRRVPASSSTAPSTPVRSAPSLPAGRSTTATMTAATMSPPTSSPSRPDPTGHSTWPRTTGATSEPADAAESSSPPDNPGPAGAPQPAKRLNGVLTGWLTSDRVRGRSVRTGPVRSAAPATSLGSPGPASALARVVNVQDAGTAEVWNLSVGDVHEYIANGIAVYNSMRFGVALDLWAKGDRDWHAAEKDEPEPHPDAAPPPEPTPGRAPTPVPTKGESLLRIDDLAAQIGLDRAAVTAKFRQAHGNMPPEGLVGCAADVLAGLANAVAARVEEMALNTAPTP